VPGSTMVPGPVGIDTHDASASSEQTGKDLTNPFMRRCFRIYFAGVGATCCHPPEHSLT